MPRQPLIRIIGIAGALAGAALGFWGVDVLARHGFYAIVLPAGLLGIFAGLVSKERSNKWAILYAALGYIAALLTDWRLRPYRVDSSLSYFVQHFDRLHMPIVLVL